MPVCCPKFENLRLKSIGRAIRQTASLMVGQPDYDAYAAHMALTHPGQNPMTKTEFFRNREAARFGMGNNGGFKCC